MYVYTLSLIKQALPKSMIYRSVMKMILTFIPDLFGHLSRIFSGFRSQWIMFSPRT